MALLKTGLCTLYICVCPDAPGQSSCIPGIWTRAHRSALHFNKTRLDHQMIFLKKFANLRNLCNPRLNPIKPSVSSVLYFYSGFGEQQYLFADAFANVQE